MKVSEDVLVVDVPKILFFLACLKEKGAGNIYFFFCVKQTKRRLLRWRRTGKLINSPSTTTKKLIKRKLLD